MKKPSFYKGLSFDKQTGRCTDKIAQVSLFHSTGQINIITKSGEQNKVRLDDLITQLTIEQFNRIVKTQSTIFENKVIFKYPKKRADEFDKIVTKAKLRNILDIRESDLGCLEAIVQINNVNLDLIMNETTSISA